MRGGGREAGRKGGGHFFFFFYFFFWYIKLTCGKACLGGRAITDTIPFMCLLKGLHLRHFSLSHPSDFYVLSLISLLVFSNRDDSHCLITERVVWHRSVVPPVDPPPLPRLALYLAYALIYMVFFMTHGCHTKTPFRFAT